MATPLRIRAVDGASPTTHALLLWMQFVALPFDAPVDTSTGLWWVAYEGDIPAGFAGLSPSSQDPNGGYLCRAGVLPTFRGRGLQRRLISFRERKARSLGMSALYTDTYCNPHSANNLITQGFRMYQPQKEWAADGACYWKKTLNVSSPRTP